MPLQMEQQQQVRLYCGTGTITFAPNVTTQNIPIAVLADTVERWTKQLLSR